MWTIVLAYLILFLGFIPSSAAETNPFIAGSVRVGLNLREGG
jgi:hypothetical protein